MPGEYCRFCGHRCFVERTLPDGRHLHMATCADGAAFDQEKTGFTFQTATNPRAESTPMPTPTYLTASDEIAEQTLANFLENSGVGSSVDIELLRDLAKAATRVGYLAGQLSVTFTLVEGVDYEHSGWKRGDVATADNEPHLRRICRPEIERDRAAREAHLQRFGRYVSEIRDAWDSRLTPEERTRLSEKREAALLADAQAFYAAQPAGSQKSFWD